MLTEMHLLTALAALLCLLVAAAPTEAQLAELRPGRAHCESVRMLQLSDMVHKDQGMYEWRRWLREVRPRCDLAVDPLPVTVVDLGKKDNGRKNLVGLRSPTWKGVRYGFREELSWKK